jgi:hypothetical protein
MPTSTLELLMYQIGQLFLFPVLVLVAAMFAYSFYALGSFILQALQRRRRSQHLAGFPLLQHVRRMRRPHQTNLIYLHTNYWNLPASPVASRLCWDSLAR